MNYNVSIDSQSKKNIKSKKNEAIIYEVIKYYEDKASEQKTNARTFLYGIIICLIVCVGIFLFANIITESRSSKLAEVNAEEYETQLMQNNDTLNILKNKIPRIKDEMAFNSDTSAYYGVDSVSVVDSIKAARHTIKLTPQQIVQRKKDSIAEVLEIRAEHKKQLKIDMQLLDSLDRMTHRIDLRNKSLSASLDKKNAKTNIYDFINSTSTRIGAILILIFMVQLLSSIYRYNTKLANFYSARAMALKLHLSGDEELSIAKVIKIIANDNIEIKATKPPTDKAMDLVQKSLETVAKLK